MQTYHSYRDREWKPQPQAERFLLGFLGGMLDRCPPARNYADRLLSDCAVRLRDIVDHLTCDDAPPAAAVACGWEENEPGIWENRRGQFPPFVRAPGPATLFLRVESIDSFADAVRPGAEIDGEKGAIVRRMIAFEGAAVRLGAIERNGYAGHAGAVSDPQRIAGACRHLRAFRTRVRRFDDPATGLAYTEALVDAAVAELGPHWACSLWLDAERDYWLQRCPPARTQKARQDAAGIGWSNIDHHTYDGSRAHFRHTIRILEKLGYELREMLYAGALAGWGSQILEQPVLKSTIFADVDLAPDELEVDFAHEALPPLDRHRRAGLVSALHGESILEAGLNHVAGLYDRRRLHALLDRDGVAMMAPFSDMPHLYQALTQGSVATVDPDIVAALAAGGHIDAAQAEDIRRNGAVLSHLENIERNEGYKGFNKPGIDDVLRKLDPRARTAEA